MPCYHPVPGWYAKRLNPTGRRSIVFRLDDAHKDRPVPVPCGNCIGCQLEKARQWALRCMHEASLYERNCFVTLTYSKENLPKQGSLAPDVFVKFMKRLRHVHPGVRFFQCGEYGEKLSRPHHHAILFNCDFSDKVRLRSSKRSGVLYRSAQLEQLWPYGFSSIGEVTFQSAGYVARYALKKVKGSAAAGDHYGVKQPEYATMSRRPGIGRGWLEKYLSDVYPSDEVVVNGAVSKPPRYYDDVAAKMRPDLVKVVKARRRREGAEDPDNSGKRLVVREAVKNAAVTYLTRELEDDS